MKDVLVEAERTTHLLDSLLTRARGDSGAEALELIPTDVCEAVREAIEETRPFAAEKNIDIDYRMEERGIEIYADSDAIRRLFVILIDNAVKYTNPGGDIRITVQRKGDVAEAAVADTGIGIEEKDQTHIFDRFWRVDKVRSRASGGAGLGLSIARWIVYQHHGTIEVESELGRGSTFRVALPLTSGGMSKRRGATGIRERASTDTRNQELRG